MSALTTAPSAYSVVKAMVMRRVEAGDINPDGDRRQVRSLIAEAVRDYQADAHLADDVVALSNPEQMVDRVLAAVCDYGPLTDLLGRDDIEEILIQGARVSYITADGRVNVLQRPTSEEENFGYVERLLQSGPTQRQLDASKPIVTVGLDKATRLSVKIPPVVDELTVCIRKVVMRRPTLVQLVASGSLTPAAAGLLWALMQIRSRVVIAGAPFAGKTTLTNALLAAVPPHRVVRVNEEDRELTAELLMGGYAKANDRPGQTLRDLIKADLRFRPDILVVGEVRGAEAFEVLRPLNAGTGFLTTVHANAARDAIDVLTQCAVMAGERISDDEIRKLFAGAVDFVVFLDADEPVTGSAQDLRRQVMEIAWVEPELRAGKVVCEPIFARAELGKPLAWTGARPGPLVVSRIEKGLPEGITLQSILSGHAFVGGSASELAE